MSQIATATLLFLLVSACSPPAAKPFISTQQKVEIFVPAEWNDPIEDGPDRGIGGATGYVKLTAMAGPRTVADACRVDSSHRMQPYGPNPRVESIVVDGQPGCRIVPSVADAAAKRIPAGLILAHPTPVTIEPRHVHTRPYPFLVIWVDPPHLPMIERSLRFRR